MYPHIIVSSLAASALNDYSESRIEVTSTHTHTRGRGRSSPCEFVTFVRWREKCTEQQHLLTLTHVDWADTILFWECFAHDGSAAISNHLDDMPSMQLVWLGQITQLPSTARNMFRYDNAFKLRVIQIPIPRNGHRSQIVRGCQMSCAESSFCYMLL